MKAVLKYTGAKNRLAEWINSYIPNHIVYVELFFGSGGVFFNKPRSHIETINDLNDDVVNFFKVLREQPEKLAKLIYLTPYSRAEYDSSYENSENISELEKARRYCVRCWQGFGCANLYHNGFKSGQQTKSPNPARGFSQLPDTLLQAAERLRGVQIENLPAVEVINRYDTADVFIYADPPYLHSTRKNYLYKHEMTDEDHIELLDLLVKHSGKVLISGYDNDLYNEMLYGWNKAQKITLAEGGEKRIETLWMNYEPPARQMSFDDYGGGRCENLS